MDARRAVFCLAAFGAAVGLGACGSDPVTGLPAKLQGCPEVLPPASCVDVPSFARDLRPILARSCAGCHHDSLDPNALWPLTDYGDVSAWNDLIKHSLLNCSQPPASSVYPFSEEDRETILKWTLCNHPP